MVQNKVTPKVSIIMPVYNGEKYINRSIESVLNQKLEEIELIIINDGSYDNTIKIVEKFIETDKRIRIVHQENLGVSAARNRGLEVAKGEYIGFVDSDDWIDPDMYLKLYDVGKQTDSDVVTCSYLVYYDDTKYADTYTGIKRFEKLVSNTVVEYNNLNHKLKEVPTHMNGAFWCGIYRNELIKRNKISFDKNLAVGEDILFKITCFMHAKRFFYLPKQYYYYSTRVNSVMGKYDKSMFERQLQFIKAFINMLENFNVNVYNNPSISIKLLHHINNSINNEFKKGNDKKLLDKINFIKKVINEPLVRKLTLSSKSVGSSKLEKYIYTMYKNKYTMGLALLAFYTNMIVPKKLKKR